MEVGVRAGRRLLRTVTAFVAADLITGMAAFSLITLGSLWFISASFLRICAEYEALGINVASGMQLFLAWVGALVTIPLMVGTVYLAVRAYSIPKAVYRSGGRGALGGDLREDRSG